jgi:hypothetical protein
MRGKPVSFHNTMLAVIPQPPCQRGSSKIKTAEITENKKHSAACPLGFMELVTLSSAKIPRYYIVGGLGVLGGAQPRSNYILSMNPAFSTPRVNVSCMSRPLNTCSSGVNLIWRDAGTRILDMCLSGPWAQVFGTEQRLLIYKSHSSHGILRSPNFHTFLCTRIKMLKSLLISCLVLQGVAAQRFTRTQRPTPTPVAPASGTQSLYGQCKGA